MSATTSLPNVDSNSNQEQSDSKPRHQLPSTHQGPLCSALGIGQGPLTEIHPSSSESADHSVVDNRKGSPERLPNHHQECQNPYQDCMDTSDAKATMFQNARGLSISGDPHFVNKLIVNQHLNPKESKGVENFKHFVSFEALHDSNVLDIDRVVDPVIRMETLKQSQDWMDNPNTTEQVAWLHGPASIGKTALALEIARQKNVVATFFFSGHSDKSLLFPTLAWQLARSIPEIHDHIIDSMVEYPDLLNKRLDEQFDHLVAQPFAAMKKVMSALHPSSLIVIIDGIDECADTRLQRKYLKAIGKGIVNCLVPLRFIICSRTDAQIQTIFDELKCPVFAIDLAKFDPAEEIRKIEEDIIRREERLKKREEELEDHGRAQLAGLQEEQRQREEELKKREEELKKREDEVQELRELKTRGRQQLAHVQEEQRQQEEELKKREENLKKREEEVLRLRELESHGRAFLQAEQRQREEELKKQEKNLKKREEEVLRLRELESQGKEQVARLQDEQRQQEENLKKREEEVLRLRETEIYGREYITRLQKELKTREEKLKTREEKLKAREDGVLGLRELESRRKQQLARLQEEQRQREEGLRKREQQLREREVKVFGSRKLESHGEEQEDQRQREQDLMETKRQLKRYQSLVAVLIVVLFLVLLYHHPPPFLRRFLSSPSNLLPSLLSFLLSFLCDRLFSFLKIFSPIFSTSLPLLLLLLLLLVPAGRI